MKRTRDVFWALSPEVLEEVLEQIKFENKGVVDVSTVLNEMSKSKRYQKEDDIAIISISGPLQKNTNIFSRILGFSTYDLISREIKNAILDPNIAGIVLDIDSPGGEVNGCSELAKIIADGTKYKPIIAYGSGDIASGAYWIASAANKIVASDTSSVGSIGVVGVYEKKDKNEFEIVSSQSPLKRVDPKTPEGRAHVQSKIDDLADVFISAVANNRGTTKENVIENFGNGSVLIGEKARKAGLIDEVGTLSSVFNFFVNKNKGAMENNNTNLAEDKSNFEEGLVSGKFSERDRVLSILQMGFDENVSRDFLKTAIESDLDLEVVRKLIKTAPKEEKSNTDFYKVMSKIENPKIELSKGDEVQSIDVLAQAIAKIN